MSQLPSYNKNVPFSFQLHQSVMQGNSHAVHTNSTTQIAFQIIIDVIKKLIAMMDQMNSIAVSIIIQCKKAMDIVGLILLK